MDPIVIVGTPASPARRGLKRRPLPVFRSLYPDPDGRPLGFAQTGSAVAEQMALTTDLHAWL